MDGEEGQTPTATGFPTASCSPEHSSKGKELAPARLPSTDMATAVADAGPSGASTSSRTLLYAGGGQRDPTTTREPGSGHGAASLTSSAAVRVVELKRLQYNSSRALGVGPYQQLEPLGGSRGGRG